jgi:GNAT superfamily N-acetyltransferase
MTTIEPIDEHSPLLEGVKRLWRAHSDTLGFLPDGAFREYAAQCHLLVAVKTSSVEGYLLYRTAYGRAVIVHLCVASHARKQGIARALLKSLTDRTPYCSGIILHCRRDFEAAKTWPRLGFEFNGEVAGRSASGSRLTRWLLDYNHPDLFTSESLPKPADAVIDTNVFLDLVDEGSEETLALRADWLQPFLTLCYTAELPNDINRHPDDAGRRKRLLELEQFKKLRCSHSAYLAAEATLKQLFPNLRSEQDESDFRHLVRAVAAETDVFVTRDELVLNRCEDVLEACGLSIMRPAELIQRIDLVQHERDYQPGYFAGTRKIMHERLGSISREVLDAIKKPNERDGALKAHLNCLLADAKNVKCFVLKESERGTLAVYAVRAKSDSDDICLLRIGGKRRAGTLARAILATAVRLAARSSRKYVVVTETNVDESLKAALTDLGFLEGAQGWFKVVGYGWNSLTEMANSIDRVDAKVDELMASLPSAVSDSEVATRVEHLLWPAKLAEAALPCFIVPIKADFAEQLFDERLASGSLFGTEVDLALNCEAAYYRAATPAVIRCPGRVLWYVSDSSKRDGCKAIRACSRIVEVVKGPARHLFRRFRRLGIYEWEHIKQTAKRDADKEIMAFRFDDSEPLWPVRLLKIQEILKRKITFQSPIEITSAAFGEIYAAAVDPSQTRPSDPIWAKASGASPAAASE